MHENRGEVEGPAAGEKSRRPMYLGFAYADGGLGAAVAKLNEFQREDERPFVVAVLEPADAAIIEASRRGNVGFLEYVVEYTFGEHQRLADEAELNPLHEYTADDARRVMATVGKVLRMFAPVTEAAEQVLAATPKAPPTAPGGSASTEVA